MISKTLVVLVFITLGMQAQAASLDVFSGNIVVNLGGAVTTQAGNIDAASGNVINGSDDYSLTILPAATDSLLTTIKFADFPTGTITKLALYESDGTFVDESLTGTLIASLLGTKSYVLRIVGTAATSYVVNLSAVPLPAAAVLFLSALAGFGLLSRRKSGSSGNGHPLGSVAA